MYERFCELLGTPRSSTSPASSQPSEAAASDAQPAFRGSAEFWSGCHLGTLARLRGAVLTLSDRATVVRKAPGIKTRSVQPMIDDAALASLVCSSAVRDVVRHVAVELVRLLDGGLVGVYLHGSLAMGCFTEPASDIDLLGGWCLSRA